VQAAIVLAIFIGIISNTTISSANEATNEEKNLQSITDLKFYSLSKNDQNAFDIPAAVYVITQEDIRRSGVTSIPEALKMAPGLQVAQMGGNTWAVGSRGFDYQYTNKLLVLIDGRTIYTPQFSGVFWDMHDIILEDIEKIEIIRGPGATVWGVNAVNGIINIITKSAKYTVGNAVSTYISNNNDKSISVRSGIENKSGSYRVYAKSKSTSEAHLLNGGNANDESVNNHIGFRYDNSSVNSNSTLQGDFRQGVADSFFSKFPSLSQPFYFMDDRYKESFNSNIIFKWNKRVSDTYRVNTQVYYENDYTNIVNILKRNANIIDADIQNLWEFNDRNMLTWGLGSSLIDETLRSENLSLLVYDNPKEFLYTYNTFIQNRFEIIKDSAFITLGTKIERAYFTGVEFEPSAKLELFPTDNQTIWSSVTKAVRTPSRGEDSLTLRFAGTPAGYLAITKGPNYKSEDLIAYETGYRLRYNNITSELTLFYNDYKNLRTSEPGIVAPFDDIITPLSLSNNGYGETHGIEINTKWQVNPEWKIQSSYSLLRMNLKLKDGSRDIGGPAGLLANEITFPKNQYRLSSFYNITPEIEFDTNAYFIDRLDSGVSGYTILDARIGWRPENNIDISILGKNLLDDRHQEFTQALYSFPKEISRSVFIQFKYGF
jgi:iron complex outermembrane receptor protein